MLGDGAARDRTPRARRGSRPPDCSGCRARRWNCGGRRDLPRSIRNCRLLSRLRGGGLGVLLGDNEMNLLTRQESAVRLRVSLRTFDARVKPDLTPVRIGNRVLFDAEDLDAWLATRKDGASVSR